MKVSDYILQRLRNSAADHVFAHAGDGTDGLLAAWGSADIVIDRAMRTAYGRRTVTAGPVMPPIPPHPTREQGEAVVSSVVKEDSDCFGGITKQGSKAKVQEFLPRHDHGDDAPGTQGKE
jgi:hypothetical protein